MKVLFINFEFPPIGGGGGNANAYIFNQYAEESDLEVDLITSSVGPIDELYDYSKNIRVHRLSVGKKALHFWTQREILKYIWRAHRYVGKLSMSNRYDVCHAFFGFPSGYIAFLRRQRIPYLVSLRGSDVPGFNARFSMQYVFLKPVFRRIWCSASKIVANSIGLRDLAHEFMPNLDIHVIPNGVDTDKFRPAPEGHPGSSQILCVSRLIQRKGVHHLIEAMPSIINSNRAAKLTVVGEGDYFPRLVERTDALGISKNVEFRGLIPHEKLAVEYGKAALYVQPSYYEGMSNTVLEAMASGLPIVVSSMGGNEELYRDNCVTVPFGDPQALADTIVELLGDNTRLQAMGERSRAIALGFSWQSVADQYLEIYRAMIRKRK